MRIHFERTGGVAGTALTCEVSSDTVPEADRQRLRRLVADSQVLDLPQIGVGAQQAGADRFEYRISINVDGAMHRLVIGEAGVPDTLRELIAWLTAVARHRRRNIV